MDTVIIFGYRSNNSSKSLCPPFSLIHLIIPNIEWYLSAWPLAWLMYGCVVNSNIPNSSSNINLIEVEFKDGTLSATMNLDTPNANIIKVVYLIDLLFSIFIPAYFVNLSKAVRKMSIWTVWQGKIDGRVSFSFSRLGFTVTLFILKSMSAK